MLDSYTFSTFFADQSMFDPANDALDMEFVDKFARLVEVLSKYFRPTYHGLDNIPLTEPALLAGNHGILGFDGFFVFLAVYRATGRLPRGLGDHHLFMGRFSRGYWAKIGAIPGTQEIALKYLEAGNLVNVYPGGARDAMKRPEDLYKLPWDRSKGFIRLAMKADVPVILHMAVGTDDTYRILGRSRLIGKLMGHPKYEIPLVFGWGLLPRPVKFDYYFSEPVELEGGPDDAEDDDVVNRNHELVWERGQQLLDDGLNKRKSIWFG